MLKRKGRFLIFGALCEISLLVLAIFSFAIILSETRFVNAQAAEGAVPLPVDSATNPNLPTEGFIQSPPPVTNVPTGTDAIENAVEVAGEEVKDAGVTGQEASAAGEGRGISGIIGDIYGGKLIGGTAGSTGEIAAFANPLIAGLAWGATIGLLVKFIAPLFGASENLTNALFWAIFGGATAGGFATGAIQYFYGSSIFGVQASTVGGIAGLGVGVAIFLLLYKEQNVKAVNFQCLPWEPPLGGSDCEKCNQDPFRPCSEYRCRSLGQACGIVNEGTVEERCVWTGKGDVNAPSITPWDEPLTEGLQYTNHDTLPSSLGAKIIKVGAQNGCVQAFTPLEFGILLNEPGQCKIDSLHTDNYEDMKFYFGESNYYRYNHTERISLPGPDAIAAESPELQNDGTYNYYVRCQDANGNYNVQEFVFNFCVDPSPDTTPPLIDSTSIPSGNPVSYQIGSVPLQVYVNEPAECKWSTVDQNYETMENTMTCSTLVGEINARLLYTCSTTLPGIKDKVMNTFYFRCKDQPSKPENERNVNVQSYKFELRGTQPLVILDVGPNSTVVNNTNVVSVTLTAETTSGADEGKAACYVSSTGQPDSYIAMFETNSHQHRQKLNLPAGSYTYYFRCVDAGGNSDESSTSFNVITDNQPPAVVKAYHELDALKIVTNENAFCSYSLNNCNFEINEGIAMVYSNPSVKTSHYVEWQPNILYYIRCKDDFGNEPIPNQCSIVASATTSF